MAESREYTPLLDQREKHNQEYTNLAYGSKKEPTSSFNSIEHKLTLDELLYRIQFAFLNKGYNVEGDIQQLLDGCDESDIDVLLQGLNSYPLKIQQKLEISRMLRREGNMKIRYRRGKDKKMHKRKDADSVFAVFSLWEETIKNISAYFGSNVASYFQFVRTLLYINIIMMMLMVGFIVVPEIIQGNFQTNVTYGGHFGELSNSFMFYGLYTNDLGLSYNLPLAYFLTWISANLVCFIYIIAIMIVRYRRSKLADDRGNEYKFAWRTFCSWDYSVTSRQGVMDFRTSLKTDIKEMVREEKSAVRVDSCTKFQNYMGRIFSNLIVLGLLVGSGFLIYQVADNEDLLKDVADFDFVRKYQLTATVAGLKLIVPLVFEQLVRLEGWHPRIETKITLARTTVFYIASLMVFVTSLYDVTGDQSVDSNEVNGIENSTSSCWENEVGEEVFKVVLVDLGILFVVGILFHLHRALWVKCTCKIIGYSKFDVVSSVLDVVYGQCLVWLGLYFSPLLAAISVIKLIIVFYFRYLIAKVAMVPPQQLFRASSTGNFYLALLLLNLFISLFPMTYAVLEFRPSADCGPFQGYDRPYKVIDTTDTIGELPDWPKDVLYYIGTPAVLLPILILLILLVVYFKVKSSSYKRLIRELRRQLMFERKVGKRKIFATGRAMSGGALSRYSSQESIVSTPGMKHRKVSQQTISTTITEEQEF